MVSENKELPYNRSIPPVIRERRRDKKRADYQQRMLLRHGVINTAKISAGIIKIIASNVLLLLPIISLFLLLSLLFLGVKAERQSASSAYDGLLSGGKI